MAIELRWCVSNNCRQEAYKRHANIVIILSIFAYVSPEKWIDLDETKQMDGIGKEWIYKIFDKLVPGPRVRG